MNVQDIRKILQAVTKEDIHEFVLETGDVKLTVRRGAPGPNGNAGTALAAPVGGEAASAAPAAPAPAPAPQPEPEPQAPPSHLVDVTAPIVGTFYDSPAPDASPYVKVGDRVEPGTVLCIIEAMKLMNEIEAESKGTIAEVLVRNEEPVEYGQVLFRIDPD